MLALYRAGSQAEALDVYRDGRRELHDGLGLEPGPVLQRLQRRILIQDPALELAPQPSSRGTARRWAEVAALAAGIATAVVVAATVLASEPGGPSPEAGGGALLEIDGESGEVGPSTPVGRAPTAPSG